MHSEMDGYTMTLRAEDIQQHPRLAGLLDTADSWWEPTGCVIAGVDGVGENVRYAVEVCNMSGEAGREGDWSSEADQDEI
jgi:salicylate hydroxylase